MKFYCEVGFIKLHLVDCAFYSFANFPNYYVSDSATSPR